MISRIRVYLHRMLIAAYSALWVGGVTTHFLHEGPPPDMLWTGSLFLCLAGLLVLSGLPPRQAGPYLLCGAAGFVFELIGTHTGYPFGAYRYTDRLPPSVASVPLVMIFAWLILTAFTWTLAGSLRMRRVLRILSAGAFMMGIDLIIDPLAAGPLGYWQWEETGSYEGIPASNFLGWFLVSVTVFFLAPAKPAVSPGAVWTGLSVVTFFTALALVYHVVPAAVIGVLISAGCVLFIRKNLRNAP